MNRLTLIAASALLLLGSLAEGYAALPPGPVRVALVADGPWDRNGEVLEMLNRSIRDVFGTTPAVVIEPGYLFTGDWTLAGVRAVNDLLLADTTVDMILAFGVIASHDMATRGPLPKPVIAPVVVDAASQHIPLVNGTSGVKNLSYLVYPQTFVRDIEFFKEFVNIRTIVNLTSEPYNRVLPRNPAAMLKISARLGMESVDLFVDKSAEEVLAKIPANADAVFIEPLPHLPAAEFDKLVRGLIERRLPSFSFFGDNEVRKGVFASANPDIVPRLTRRVALIMQRIIGEHEEPGSLPVAFSPGKRLTINLSTAAAIGISPRWSVLLEAELVGADSTPLSGIQMNLPDAIRQIADRSLDVQSKIREVRAEGLNTAIARSVLFPKIDLGVNGVQIDEDRAVAGGQPERSGTIEVSATQVLFSEQALANLSIQSSLQEAREYDLQATKLNTIVEGAVYYLNYLRLRRIYGLLLDNLKLTRTNLELARIRQTTGFASPEEALRWEVEIASLRKTTMDVQSQMNQALLALKQILRIPMQKQADFADVPDLDSAMFVTVKSVRDCFDDPAGFNVLSNILLFEAYRLSPELRQLDAANEAQQRNLTSLQLSPFLPTVSAFANFSNRFSASEIVSPFQMPSLGNAPAPGTPGEAFLYSVLGSLSPSLPDSRNWSLGVQLSLNLFNGMGTAAAKEKAAIQVEEFDIRTQAVTEKIELRIRVEMERAKASKFAMEQAAEEQRAARRALEITTEAYSRGAVSILSLLDAQNGALRADQVAANALYDFWISYLSLQRAIGQFDVLMAPEERADFLERLRGRIAAIRQR
jgi:outer membrane protein